MDSAVTGEPGPWRSEDKSEAFVFLSLPSLYHPSMLCYDAAGNITIAGLGLMGSRVTR